MRAEQPTKLCKPPRKMRVKIGGLNPHLSLLATPRRCIRCGFICFMFGAVQFLNVLILIFLCIELFISVKVVC